MILPGRQCSLLFRSVGVVLGALLSGLQAPAQEAPAPGDVAERVSYRGASHFTKGELDEIVGLKQGGSLSPEQLHVGCQKIVRAYTDRGRPFASCAVVEGDKPNDRQAVFS